MAKSIWAMDFGDHSLKVVRATHDKKSGTITVDLYDEIVYGTLPCGYEAGLLDKHREAIIAFRNQYEIGSSDDLCVCVPGSEVFSRFINLPPVPESIGEIIRYEARQQIPFDIDDVVWDFQPVKEEKDREIGEEIEVGLFALKKERIQELMDLLEPWRGNLRIVQDAPLAVYNLLEYEGLLEQTSVVVDIGAATTDVLVLNPPRFWLRTLLVAGDDLTNALVEQFGIGLEEAEKIKRRAGRSTHREQILRILRPVFDDLINEVQRSLGYYKSLFRDVQFDRVLLLGNALKMTGLNRVLERGLQYEVEELSALRRIEVAGVVDADRFAAALPGACAALGLLVQAAGRSRVTINMVPEEVATATFVNRKKPWALAAAIGLVLIALLLGFAERLYAQDVSRVEQRVRWGVVDTADGYRSDFDAMQAQVTQLKQKLEQIAEPAIPPDLYLKLYDVLSDTDVVPGNIYFTSVSFNWLEPGEIQAGAPGMGMGMGPPRPMMGGAGMPAGVGPSYTPEDMMDMMGGAGMGPAGMQPGGMGMGRRPAAGALGTPPLKSLNSKLRMNFSGESRVIRMGREHIRVNFFEALEKARFPDTNEPVFSEVRMVGDVQEVWRRKSDGAITREEDQAEKFVAFSGYAIVNTGSDE